jgi:uncharacterized phosphosugar-binding protein
MRTKVSRRRFLAASAGAGAGAAFGAGAAEAAGGSPAVSWKPFMDQYYDGALAIVEGIRDTQIDPIARAMEKAYELREKGGRIFSQVVYGHYAAYAGAKDVPGQPWVLPQSAITPKKEDFAAMKKGDFLITDRVDPEVKEARGRGLFVAGVTNNYFKFYKTPSVGLDPGRMKLSLEEVSDLIIDSQVPWDNGLVSAPQNPQFKLCPSTGIAQFAVYWACSASLANLVGSKGKESSSEPARKYLDLACERFRMIGTDRPKIDRIAKKWADLVLTRKARLFVYGKPYTVEGGAGNMFVSDANSAASGSMIAQSFDPKKTELRAGDIVLITSMESRDAGEIGAARAARKAGAVTTAFCPFSADGDASGERLFKEVYDALTIYCDESAGVIKVPGFGFKVCSIAGLTGLLTLWMLTASWTDHMARRGEMPYYWQGLHETGGREYDAMVWPYYEKRGY